MRCLVLLSFVCLMATLTWGQRPVKIAFWNVENYFDVVDDSTTLDDAFTPHGENHWTNARFEKKCNAIMKVFAAMGDTELPVMMGMAEVENDYVMSQLCNGTPLRKLGYDYVHFDSPDPRGIDCALVYNTRRFKPFYRSAINVSDSVSGFFTRDLLLVGGVIDKVDTLWAMVCHLPSKRGGILAEKHRLQILQKIRGIADSLMITYSASKVVIMGDFNADRREPTYMQGLNLDEEGRTASGLRDLLWQTPVDRGTYKYQGLWSVIDHVITNVEEAVAEIMEFDFLLVPDKTNKGMRVNRTYLGMRYQGGYSDHLPIVVSW